MGRRSEMRQSQDTENHHPWLAVLHRPPPWAGHPWGPSWPQRSRGIDQPHLPTTVHDFRDGAPSSNSQELHRLVHIGERCRSTEMETIPISIFVTAGASNVNRCSRDPKQRSGSCYKGRQNPPMSL